MTTSDTHALIACALTCLVGLFIGAAWVRHDQRRRRRAAIVQALRDCAPVYDWASDDLWADFQATEPKR